MGKESFNRSMQYYQSANMSDDEIKKHFIVRRKEFEKIVSEIKRDDMTGSIQHFIIVGRRGSGKSTLLRRIEAEVKTDNTLNTHLIAINLSEEQAGVYRFFDLWSLIIHELQQRCITVEEPEWKNFKSDSEYSEALYINIQKVLKNRKLKMILLLDNIDRIFDNIGDDAHFLRGILMNHKDIRIIGGSTRMGEHYWKYNNPFYEFFRIIRLESLSQEEVKELLQYWGTLLDIPDLDNITVRHPGKLNAIRMLTDGMPRTLLHFIEILIDRPGQNGFEYLRYIIDRATPLYQERLNNLSPAQRKIVLELSFFWDAVKVMDLKAACKMEGKILSAQLNQLVKDEIVEKIHGIRKDNLYRLSERFFNLWLLMTQGGPKEKHQVKYLTIFLENWYDKEELLKIFAEHSEGLKLGKLNPDYAILMTKALAHLKYLTIQQRDSLLETTKALHEIDQSQLEFLPELAKNILEDIRNKIRNKEYSEARLKLKEIEQEDGVRDLYIGICYFFENKFSFAIKHLKNSLSQGNKNAFFPLGLTYKMNKKEDKAIDYLIKASNNGVKQAMDVLARIYFLHQDFILAEKYYKMALEKGNHNSLLGLGEIYISMNEYKKAEEVLLKAIEMKQNEAFRILAKSYINEGQIEKAENILIKGISLDDYYSILTLSMIYYFTNDKKDRVRSYLGELLKNAKYPKEFLSISLLLLWTGEVEKIESMVSENINQLINVDGDRDSGLSQIIEHLLIHKQYTLVWNLFSDVNYGNTLKELLRPLYYVAASFIDGLNEKEEIMKQGPELVESFLKIKDRIKKWQLEYYP